MDKTNTIYMIKIRGTQDLLTYAMSIEEDINIWVFTNNQAILKGFEDPNKCLRPQIIQGTMLYFKILEAQSKSV